MQRVGRLLGAAVGCCVAIGCGSTQATTGTASLPPDAGSASGGGAVDAGGGGGTGGVDAGGGGGTGGVDAGAGGGGGADGGTTASDCDGLAPTSLGTERTWSTIFDGINGACGLAIGNADGTVAQMKTDRAASPYWYLIDPRTNVARGNYGLALADGAFLPSATVSGLESAFFSYVDEGAFHFHLARVADDGSSTQISPTMHLYADEHVEAMDGRGELLAVAGAISVAGQPDRRRILNQRAGPVDLARDAAIFGIGANSSGQILVIQAGDCTGCVSGQWFNPDLSPQTGAFTLITGFTAGSSTWFETAQLIGTGLAVRRMDSSSGVPYPYTSQWLATVDGGSATSQAAPAWLAARPNTNLKPVRGQRAYAILPNGTQAGPCSQQLEVVSPSGNSCAHFDLPLSSGTCDTSELRLGEDGTVLQHTPTSLESNPNGRPQSCTLHDWPGALR